MTDFLQRKAAHFQVLERKSHQSPAAVPQYEPFSTAPRTSLWREDQQETWSTKNKKKQPGANKTQEPFRDGRWNNHRQIKACKHSRWNTHTGSVIRPAFEFLIMTRVPSFNAAQFICILIKVDIRFAANCVSELLRILTVSEPQCPSPERCSRRWGRRRRTWCGWETTVHPPQGCKGEETETFQHSCEKHWSTQVT